MNDLIKIESNNEVSMTTVEIAERTGKRHDHVMRDTEKMLAELHGEGDLPKFGEVYKTHLNQEYKCYRLPKREVLILVSGYSIKLRAAIIDRLDELERGAVFQLPDFNNPVEAARAWADEREQRMLETARADEAVRTKAQISDKKTATALATASAATRRANKLADELGQGKNWKQVKAIDWIPYVFRSRDGVTLSQIGKHLTKISKEKGREVRKVDDTKYGKVNAYHAEVISAFREMLESDAEIMSKYRIDLF